MSDLLQRWGEGAYRSPSPFIWMVIITSKTRWRVIERRVSVRREEGESGLGGTRPDVGQVGSGRDPCPSGHLSRSLGNGVNRKYMKISLLMMTP